MAEQKSDKGGSVAEQHSVVEGAPDTTSSQAVAECDLPDEETRLAVQKALDDALVTVGLGELSLSGEGEEESVHGPSNSSGITEYLCYCPILHIALQQAQSRVWSVAQMKKSGRRSPWRW